MVVGEAPGAVWSGFPPVPTHFSRATRCRVYNCRQHHRSDDALKMLLQAKEAGERPPPGELQHCSMDGQRLLQLWDQLVVEDGVLYRQYINGDTSLPTIPQLVVPQAGCEEIIRQIHGGDTCGHLGFEKTVHKLKKRYYWPGHWSDVKLFCKTCTTCNAQKGTTPRPRAPRQSVQAGYPMQLVAINGHCGTVSRERIWEQVHSGSQ